MDASALGLTLGRPLAVLRSRWGDDLPRRLVLSHRVPAAPPESYCTTFVTMFPNISLASSSERSAM